MNEIEAMQKQGRRKRHDIKVTSQYYMVYE